MTAARKLTPPPLPSRKTFPPSRIDPEKTETIGTIDVAIPIETLVICKYKIGRMLAHRDAFGEHWPAFEDLLVRLEAAASRTGKGRTG